MTPVRKARPTAKLTATLPPIKVTEEMRQQVSDYAELQDVTMGDVIREAVQLYMKRVSRSTKNSQDE